jgi:hypothetical protein
MPELVAIWLAGLVILLLFFALAAPILRYTRFGRAQQISPGELLKVLAVCIALCCALYSLLTIVA